MAAKCTKISVRNVDIISQKKKMILLDLFSGLGGFHIGLKAAGFEFEKVYYSEIEKYACQIYQKRFPGSIALGDIMKIKPETIQDVDIITAGFPCQDVSIAGKRKGLEHGGKQTRTGLFWEIIRLGRIIRPRIIFLENVTGLLSHNGGRTFGVILGAISEIGYNAEWKIVSAADVGAVHRRERIWIICYEK